MGIHLDWEVESDSGHEAVNEDAAVIAARQRKRVWNRRALIVAAVVLLIGAAIAAYRIREVRTAMRETLNATVESEALALRLGDKRKFMAIQGAAEDWRSKQREAFDMFQRAGLAISVTGTILDVQMGASEARVSVEVMVNSQPTEAVWLYEYTSEGGWRHVATEVEPWSMIDQEGKWFTLNYYPVDSQYANLVDGYLVSWWEQAVAETGYDKTLPELTVVIDPDAERFDWEGDGYKRLIVPTIYEPTTKTPLLDMERLADAAAEYWTFTVYGEEIPAFARWLKHETETWFEDMFVPQEQLDAVIFAQLQAAYGEEVMSEFFSLRREYDILPHLAMKQAIDNNTPKNLQGEELNQYLTMILRAEASMEMVVNDNVARWDSAVGQIFMDSYVPGDSLEGFMVTYDTAKPETIQVLSTEVIENILWARVRFAPIWNDPNQPEQVFDAYVPFRNEDGAWKHTYLRQSDGGGVYVDRGDNVMLIYDTQHRSMAANMRPALERIHAEAARTFGIEGMPITFVLQTQSYNYPSGTQDTVYLPSPYYICCLEPDQNVTDYALMTAANEVINMMYNRQMTASGGDYFSYNSVDWAILDIARSRTGVPPTDMFWGQPITAFANSNLPRSIHDLWQPDQGWYDDQTRYENYARIMASKALIDVIMAQYGEEALPALVKVRGTAFGADEWLTNGLGITVADIDAAWWARFVEMMEAQFGAGVMDEYVR